MDKLDLKKQYRQLYSPSAKAPEIVEVPPLSYIIVDGHGDPNTAPEYSEAIQTLYNLSYTLKFHIKKTLGRDYGVMGLEGLWWIPDMSKFTSAPKSDWDWTMMILQPDFITPALFEEAKQLVRAKASPRRWIPPAWKLIAKARRFRSCTLVPTRMKDPPSPACTSSRLTRAIRCTVNTTRST